MPFESRRSFPLVGAFILIYVTSWTVITSLLDPSVPYDALEALNWAYAGEFGSPKNPYFVGWVTSLGLMMEPVIPISVYWYLSHFVGVGTGMLGVWLLGNRLFGDNQIAVLSLLSLNVSGIINIDIIPYNDNYLLVTMWPYIFLFFIKAVYDNSYYWYPLAVVCGLAAMSKYSSCVFLSSMFVCTLLVPQARKAYQSATIYLAILLMFLIALPNIVWLWQHDFAAFNWVESQLTSGLNTMLPVFLVAVFYPVALVAMIIKRRGARWAGPDTPEKKLILQVFLPPVIFVLGYLLIHRGGSMTEWLEPFVVLGPVVLFCVTDFKQIQGLQSAICFYIGMACVVLLAYSLVLILNLGGAGAKNNFVSKTSADINAIWREKYNRPLKYVGGSQFSHWLTFYAPDRPRVVTPWSNKHKPNIYNASISEADVRRDGALLISSPGLSFDEATLALDLSIVPGMKLTEYQEFSFQNERGETVTVRLGFLPPEDQ